jgi:L-lysine 6-transaminase
MRKNALTKEQVNKITPQDVHQTLQRTMLVDGFGLVVDFQKSNGMYLHDAKGNKDYLDFFSYFASWAVGHNHAKMMTSDFKKKIAEVALQNPANSDLYTVPMAQFVATFERVCMPDEFKHLFFISGGTLAVENALKVAFDWKTRKNIAAGKGEKGYKIIHFKEAFHGRSGYTLSLTNTHDLNKNKLFAKFADWPRIDNPKITFPLAGENLKNVIEAEKAAVKQIEDAFTKFPDDIAAIIIETIQGEGGDNHFRPEFIQELRRLTNKYDAMLIVDEVQAGIGLTGKMWAYQHFGIVPDIVAFGKKVQVCGIMVTGRVDEAKDNVFVVASRINSTWGGNLTDMVRAQRILEIIEEENLVENAAQVGSYLLAKFEAMSQQFPKLISNVRGRGLMCAFDLPNTELRGKFRELCYDQCLMILASGPKSVRCRPALICSNKDVDAVIAIMSGVLKKMS